MQLPLSSAQVLLIVECLFCCCDPGVPFGCCPRASTDDASRPGCTQAHVVIVVIGLPSCRKFCKHVVVAEGSENPCDEFLIVRGVYQDNPMALGDIR